MGLETGTYVLDLVETNPISTDKKSAGDDHIRLVKEVLRNTFPNASKSFSFPTHENKSADFTVTESDENKLFTLDTSAGLFSIVLPSPSTTPQGWSCGFMKTTLDTNPVLFFPPAGFIVAGERQLTRARRCIPFVVFRAYLLAGAWFLERCVSVPIGTVLDCWYSTLPVGYEWANGQILSGAADFYTDYNTHIGSGATPDACGRVVAGRDDMGEASNKRLTVALDGDTLGAAGGAETQTLTSAESGQKAISGAPVTIVDPGHGHNYDPSANANIQVGAPEISLKRNAAAGNVATTANNTTGITASLTLAGSSAVSAHNNVQPTIVLNKIVVVE
jgi:microcystin-dependent protein